MTVRDLVRSRVWLAALAGGAVVAAAAAQFPDPPAAPVAPPLPAAPAVPAPPAAPAARPGDRPGHLLPPRGDRGPRGGVRGRPAGRPRDVRQGPGLLVPLPEAGAGPRPADPGADGGAARPGEPALRRPEGDRPGG